MAESLSDRFKVDAAPCVTDLSDDSAIHRAARLAHERFGRLDVLVNAAALVGTSQLDGWVSAFDSQRLDVWRNALDINLTAPFALAQCCAPLLKDSGHVDPS